MSTNVLPSLKQRYAAGRWHFVISLSLIIPSFCLYIWTDKYKVYYVGWTVVLLWTLALSAAKRLDIGGFFRACLPVIVFYGYATVSAAWSVSPRTTLVSVAVNVLVFIVMAVSFVWARNTPVGRLSYYFELIVLADVVIMAGYLVTQGVLVDAAFGALRTEFGFATATAIPMLIWRTRNRPTIWRAVVLAVAVVVSLALGSRSALITLPISVFGVFLFTQRPRGRALNWAGLFKALGGLCVIAGLLLAIPSVRDAAGASLERFGSQALDLNVSSVTEDLNGPKSEQVDLDRRLQLFVALQSFVTHPLVGAGYGSTRAIIESQFGFELSAHGLPSMLLGETGLIGTALFCWVIVRFFRRILVKTRTEQAIIVAGFYQCCGVVMINMLVFGMFHQLDHMPAFFMVLAWGYAIDPATLQESRTATVTSGTDFPPSTVADVGRPA